MSSPRSLAEARNRQMIAESLQSNPLIQKAVKNGTLTKAAADSIGLTINGKLKTDIVQSAFGNSGISAAVQRMQQELSEEFGIPTFDVLGNISTVPQTRPINEDIFVGTGRFTESAFKKSLEVLSPKTNPITNFTSGVNDIILKPIIDEFGKIFTDRNITDLPLEQQNRVKAIDLKLQELNKKLIEVPPCTYSSRGAGFKGNQQQFERVENCTEHDAAENFNRPINAEITLLTNEREEIFKVYAVVAGFENKLKEESAKLKQLIEKNPLTASLKTAIGEEIQIASKLIEEILTKQVQIQQKSLAELQSLMVTGAHRLQEQIVAGADTSKNLADTILDNLTNFGQGLGDLGGVLDAIITGITDSFDSIFNPSVEDIIKKQEKMYEYQMTEYAKFVEEAQAFLERGKTR